MTGAGATSASRAARFALLASLVALTVAGWVWLWPMHRVPAAYPDPSAAMAMAWTPSHAALMLVMWSVMMAAMMLPTALPMLLAVERMAGGRPGLAPFAVAAAFVLGYVVVWTGFSALATAAQWALDRAGLMTMAMATADRGLSAAVLLVAGAFQLTPLKSACLARCRSPMGFLLTEWRPGVGGSFVTGLRHGLYCTGCCCALMLLLFVFGTMNLVAALALATLVLAEKALPAGVWIGRAAGIGFLAWGGLLLVA